LDRLHCFDEGDGPGAAEPYLWAVFFQIDGTTAFVDETFHLAGTGHTFNSLGNHKNLDDESVHPGDNVTIPQQFGFGNSFIPIPLKTPVLGVSEIPWVIGCVVVLMEEDNTPESAVEHGRSELRIAVQDAIDDLIPTLGINHQSPTPEEFEAIAGKISDRVESAVADHVGGLSWLGGFGNMDDEIGDGIFLFTQDNFASSGPEPITFSKRWHSEGDWEIFGHAWIEWSPWRNLGGGLTAAPAVSSWDHTRLDVFVRGTDNHMWHRWGDGLNWSGWEDLGGPPGTPIVVDHGVTGLGSVAGVGSVASVTDGVAASVGEAAVVGVAGVGAAGTGVIVGGGGPVGLPQELTSAPAAVSWGQNRIDTFARGGNGHMWHKWWDGGAWSGWEDLGGDLTSAVGVASWAANRLDCFARGPRDHMWHKWWDGSTWSQWEDLGGQCSSAPAAVSWGHGRIDCFVRGYDNKMWHKWFDASGWSDWEDLGGSLAAAPAVAARGENRLDCFVRGDDNQMWRRSWTGEVWTEWEALGGGITEAPAAVARGRKRIDCFVRGQENNLWQKSWGPDQLPAPVNDSPHGDIGDGGVLDPNP
jgi:hypothetical protein